ncbi:MAG: biotin transporter BioY [Dehalococcoidia bacterium]|nr:biotin transporter BioY [Dehalococcoidia bacterium]MSQ17919.1 biotin transporter BioY [Dehalococcoidia bacterium]
MTTAPLLIALLPARSPAQRIARDVVLMAGFSLIVALSARIAIPLGFTPVPVTLQTLAVLLTGAVLGSKRGAGAMTLYLIEGAWLPVFAGGRIGPVWELASGGYIIGFIPAAFVVGLLCERGWDRRVWIMLAMLAGNVLIYIPGLIQLSFFVPEGKVLAFGLYPFIAGDLVKLYVASLLVPAAWLLVSRWRRAGAPWS